MTKLETETTQQVDTQLSQSWFDRASEAARRFNLPVPEDIASPSEVQQQLRQFEQEDGE